MYYERADINSPLYNVLCTHKLKPNMSAHNTMLDLTKAQVC